MAIALLRVRAYGTQEYGYSFTKSTTGAGDYYNALRGMIPWSVPYDADGNYIEYPTGDVNIQNPIDELKYTQNQRKNFRINSLTLVRSGSHSRA